MPPLEKSTSKTNRIQSTRLEIKFNKNDLFVSNIPIEAPPIEVIYLSTIPTKTN